jgi:hypothetical protein
MECKIKIIGVATVENFASSHGRIPDTFGGQKRGALSKVDA